MVEFSRIFSKSINYIVVGIVIFSLALCGCENVHRYIPKDVEPIKVEIVRFDSAQLAIRVDSVGVGVKKLYADYEEFMPLYMEGILGLPSGDTMYFSELYAQFLIDTVMGFAQTNAKAKVMFENIDSLQESLNTAFTRLHYLYPEWEIPTVYLYVSGFNSSTMYYEDIIGAGVDMYLGSDYPYYHQMVYNYQKQTMRKECIAIDLLNMYMAYNIPYNSNKNRLLEKMIFRGKQMFLLSELLPDEPEWEILGYTKEQWDWCERYEQGIWNRIMEKRDLFKTESVVQASYINDGPFTAEVSQESPGRLGVWVGWQIVDSYMRHNEDVTIQELMLESDAQKVLENSYYKP